MRGATTVIGNLINTSPRPNINITTKFTINMYYILLLGGGIAVIGSHVVRVIQIVLDFSWETGL